MSSTAVKKRKRPSPFRIKVGCVVALRYKPITGNHVTLVVPPAPDETAQTKPSKHPLLCLVGSDSHVEVWTDPIPGRDEGLALIGRRVRCFFMRAVHSDRGKAAMNGTEERCKKTRNFIVEGEVVSILENRKLNETKSRKAKRVYDCGIDVELLVDRDMLGKCPFLERTDEDVNIEQFKKESAKRAYRNEEAIKGKNKVIVKVTLADSSGIVCDSEDANGAKQMEDVAKWAIRKRIPNEPGQIFDFDSDEAAGKTKKETGGTAQNGHHKESGELARLNNDTNQQSKGEERPGEANKPDRTAVGDEASDPSKKKHKLNGSKKSQSAPTKYMGNKFDDEAQQQRNWRWFSARFYDLYLAETIGARDPASKILNGNTFDFFEYYSKLLPSCGGIFGEVLEVTPSSRVGTLAMVTIRRLILPQQLASGRTTVLDHVQCGPCDVFDDYDSTLTGRKIKSEKRADEDKNSGTNQDNSLCSVIFRVPIEELVIVSRDLKRCFQSLDPGSRGESSTENELVIRYSYSWQADCLVSLKNMVQRNAAETSPALRPLTKKKLKKLSLCHQCRAWWPNKQMTTCKNENCALQQQLLLADEKDEVCKLEPFGWCDSCLGRMKDIDSVIDHDFSKDSVHATALPCCQRLCRCRLCHTFADQISARSTLQNSLESARARAKRAMPKSSEGSNVHFDLESSVFGDTESLLQSAPPCSFDISANFLDLRRLPLAGNKPITKVKPSAKRGPGAVAEKRKRDNSVNKRATKKPKGSNSRAGTPTPTSVVVHRAAKRASEDYSVFKPTCARLMDYESTTMAKALRSADDEERSTSKKVARRDRPRNLRELMQKQTSLETEKKTEKEEKSLTSRAARANQRRLVKDVALLGAAGLNLDSLSGRESQMRFDRSNIHGWGVFADVAVSAGDMIIEYRGELIGNAMAEKREKEYEAAKIGSDYMFRIDGLTVCDATKQGNVARFINASCDPNCHTKIITIDGKQRIVIYAKKDINVGEELCYDYKFSLEQDETKRIPCCCGSPECRGFMNWDKKLS